MSRFPTLAAVTGMLAAASWALVACATSADPDPPGAGTNNPGLEVPADPYPAFPYASDAQRRAFKSYLHCAHRLGVNMDGPYADSKGKGVLLRIHPGSAEPSASDRARVMRRCPQGVVAFAITPGSSASAGALKHALRTFAGCITAHGVPGFPIPDFGPGDAYDSLTWTVNWDNPSVIDAARQCIEPLREFMMAG
jgi:hypothetical protein